MDASKVGAEVWGGLFRLWDAASAGARAPDGGR